MPRAALLSLHGRVERIDPTAWEDRSLVQVWGPRYNAYVVPRRDVAPFTLGRLPEGGSARQRADDIAGRLDAFLAGRTLSANDAGNALGMHPNGLRYAAPTLARTSTVSLPGLGCQGRPFYSSSSSRPRRRSCHSHES